jgi:hypothetical protein
MAAVGCASYPGGRAAADFRSSVRVRNLTVITGFILKFAYPPSTPSSRPGRLDAVEITHEDRTKIWMKSDMDSSASRDEPERRVAELGINVAVTYPFAGPRESAGSART